jgi:hypothetical protein
MANSRAIVCSHVHSMLKVQDNKITFNVTLE